MKNEVLKNREKYNRTNLSIDLNQHIDLSDLNNTGQKIVLIFRREHTSSSQEGTLKICSQEYSYN